MQWNQITNYNESLLIFNFFYIHDYFLLTHHLKNHNLKKNHSKGGEFFYKLKVLL